MGKQTWQQTLVTQQAAGTLFNTYTTAKSVINAQALWVQPAGFWYVGRKVRVTVKGGVSNIVTTPGLMNFQVKLGPTANIAVFDTGNIQLNATAHTTLPFWLEIELTCRSVGAGTSATLMGLANVTGRMFTLTAGQTDDAQGMQTILAPATAMAVGTGFDSTTASIMDFWVGFTISNAGNGVQIQTYAVEDLGDSSS
jgi:hypothetical protein